MCNRGEKQKQVMEQSFNIILNFNLNFFCTSIAVRRAYLLTKESQKLFRRLRVE